MDFTSSSGSGGRKWRAFNISFSTTDTDVNNKNKLVNLLTSYKKFQPYVNIPHDYFHVDNKYTFSIYMCTFLLGNYILSNLKH